MRPARRSSSNEAKIELLAGVPLFSGCSRSELERIAQLVDEIEVPEGRVLIREGDLGREAFVVVSGEAEVTIDDQLVAKLGSGDCLGEMSLLAGNFRTATVVATTGMQLIVLDSRSFESLLDDVPSVTRKVLRQLAERVVRSEREVPH